MTAKRLVIAGAGAFGRELINWARDAADTAGGPPVTGFIDRSRHALDAYDYGLEWRGDIDDYVPADDEAVLIAVGAPGPKQEVVARLRARGAVFATLIHPSATIARTARLGAGVIVCPQSVISADAQVDDFVAINVISSVGHDVHVGAFCTLSAHVDLMGSVSVGEGVFFGSGARVLPKMKIAAGSTIGAGATIMRSVAQRAVMYAQPAKKL
jgi:sugar O-acyltransferase (sialic acid O-acetyltransferase NeuD family)